MAHLHLFDSSDIPHRFTPSGLVDVPWLSVKIVRLLNDSPTQRVFYANMTSSCVSPSNSVAVVVKLANHPTFIPELEMEERVYRHLQFLQGSVIPKCYGLYEGCIHENRVKCLLLEYCQPDLNLLGGIHKTQYDAMLRIISKIHEQGVIHGNLTDSSHIIVQNGLLRIISFSKSKIHTEQNNGISYILSTKGRPGSLKSLCHSELAEVASYYGLNLHSTPIMGHLIPSS